MTEVKPKEPCKKKQSAGVVTTPIFIAYKGFDKELKCREYKFEVGKNYVHNGKVEACRSGFHACENPFDVWSYYGVYESRFAIVEMSGDLSRSGDDSKIASASITIKAELNLARFIDAAIKWVWERVDPLLIQKIDVGVNSDNDAQIGSSGYGARIGSSGNDARIGSSGSDTQIGSSGNCARIGSSGNDARIGSSGNGAQIGSSGNGARIGSSGNDARIGSSGYGARIGSSGSDTQIGSSGNGARIGSSGYGARIGSSGNCARIDSTGNLAVIACAGSVDKFRLGAGGCISVPYFDGVRTRFVNIYEGENGIKPDVWYRLSEDSAPVEVKL